MVNYWHVRISAKHQPMKDFLYFLNDITLMRKAQWDSDTTNHIKQHDYLGFITGPNGKECVKIYLVTKVLTSEKRHMHWATHNPHTKGNGIGSVDHRDVIILSDIHSLVKHVEWNDVRKATGLGKSCSHWMPRGTQRVRQPHLLPFNFPV